MNKILGRLASAAQAKRPNILFIIVDDQSPYELQVYNKASTLQTPNIDRLAAEGMVFDGAYHMGAFVGAVCTPHVGPKIYEHNTPDEIARRLPALRRHLAHAGVDFALWDGGEVRIMPGTIDWFSFWGLPTLTRTSSANSEPVWKNSIRKSQPTHELHGQRNSGPSERCFQVVEFARIPFAHYLAKSSGQLHFRTKRKKVVLRTNPVNSTGHSGSR